MKKISAITILSVLLFTGCSQSAYTERFDALESALASQEARISELEDSLLERPTPAPTPTETPTLKPTATPVTGYFEYAQSGPEELLKFLTGDFVHLFSKEDIESTSLQVNSDGNYTIELYYTTGRVTQELFNNYAKTVAEEDDRIDWEGDSGFIQTDKISYFMYNHYEKGVVFNIMPTGKPEGVDVYFDRLADIDACMLPDELENLPYDTSITFDKDFETVDTLYSWKDLDRSAADTIAQHYKQMLMHNEWYDVNQGENGTGIFARLDDYRSIEIKTPMTVESFDVQIIVRNATVEKR